jgi:hypothetical protein
MPYDHEQVYVMLLASRCQTTGDLNEPKHVGLIFRQYSVSTNEMWGERS